LIYIEIYNEIPERRRECLYYLALGNFKLGEYTEARKYNDKLIELEPGNLQFLFLLCSLGNIIKMCFLREFSL